MFPAPLTQLSSGDGEVPVQDAPLLDALGVGGGRLVDCVDSLLDGGVDGPVFSTRDLGDSRGVAAHLPAELDSVWCELVLGVTGVRVHLTLRRRNKFK